MKEYIQKHTRYSIAFFRVLIGVLFLPCFLLMDTHARQIYYLSALVIVYAGFLQVWPQIEALINKFFPATILFDVSLISLFIYYAPYYAPALCLLYLFPIIAAAFRNRLVPTLLITVFSGGLYLGIAIYHHLNLKLLLLQVVFFFILAVYTDFLTQHFHLTYFRQANQDSLTKIHNRRYFNYVMEKLVQSNTPYTLIIMDLDDFKALNDTQGHHHGDFVLKIVAGIIKECTRSSDVVARFGGDEFAIILPQTSKETSKDIADRIRNNVLINPKLQAYKQISLSQGIASFPADGTSQEEILQKADEALYIAKGMGKNYVHLYE